MVIRRATSADINEVATLTRALAWETERARLDARTVRRGLRRLVEGPETRLYVAQDSLATPIVAFVSVSGWEWSEWTATKYLWLGAAYVAASRRGENIVGLILKEVATYARHVRARGFKSYVHKKNRRSKAAHEAYGFKQSDYIVFTKQMTARLMPSSARRSPGAAPPRQSTRNRRRR